MRALHIIMWDDALIDTISNKLMTLSIIKLFITTFNEYIPKGD